MLVVSGRVVSGHGSATTDVGNGVYGELGFEPFLGTLNLEVVGDGSLPDPERVVTVGEQNISMWPGVIISERSGYVSVWLLLPTLTSAFEVLAAVKLRELLDLVDGDVVEVLV